MTTTVIEGLEIKSPSEELAFLLAQQKEVDDTLALIEQKIYDKETAYLEETPHGNILKGWDAFLDKSFEAVKATKKDALLKKVKINDEDRCFTNSAEKSRAASLTVTVSTTPTAETSSVSAPSKKKLAKLANQNSKVPRSVGKVNNQGKTGSRGQNSKVKSNKRKREEDSD